MGCNAINPHGMEYHEEASDSAEAICAGIVMVLIGLCVIMGCATWAGPKLEREIRQHKAAVMAEIERNTLPPLPESMLTIWATEMYGPAGAAGATALLWLLNRKPKPPTVGV